ncbi:ABC transporter permease [Schlesneria paludicola]|uniref:ABC transporter permease n=1 Tax=Schlesneria paludicola TaxID=360056 RepID=UPI00029A9F55|nr:ABC transporter permease [Schlesneria paludicola]
MLKPQDVALTPRVQLADLAPLISLGTLILVFSLVASDFVSLSTFSLIMKQGAVLAIVATGLTFVLLCAEIDLSVGMIALLASCFCGVLWESSFAAGPKEINGTANVSLLTMAIVIFVPLITAILLGLVSGYLTISSGLPSFIITLAMMNIALGLARFLTRSQKFAVPPVLVRLGNAQVLEINGQRLGTLSIPQSAVVAAVVMIVAHIVLQHTRFGRYVYMTGGNRQAARLAGVRTERIVIACLAICAGTAACGGLVTAGRMNGVTLDQNVDLLLDAVACVVLGGTSLFGGEGSIGRTLIGVLSFTVLKVGLNLTNVERLVKQLPISPALKETWLKASWVTQFDLLRPFLLGVVLMIALVIHGRLVKRRTDA